MSEEYINWLIYDQAVNLLNMPEQQVAAIMGTSRYTLAKHRDNKTLNKLTNSSVARLINHLQFIKAAILVSQIHED